MLISELKLNKRCEQIRYLKLTSFVSSIKFPNRDPAGSLRYASRASVIEILRRWYVNDIPCLRDCFCSLVIQTWKNSLEFGSSSLVAHSLYMP